MELAATLTLNCTRWGNRLKLVLSLIFIGGEYSFWSLKKACNPMAKVTASLPASWVTLIPNNFPLTIVRRCGQQQSLQPKPGMEQTKMGERQTGALREAAHLTVLQVVFPRHPVVTEMMNWVHQLSVPGKSMMTVTPEDILVFLVQQWLPNCTGCTYEHQA